MYLVMITIAVAAVVKRITRRPSRPSTYAAAVVAGLFWGSLFPLPTALILGGILLIDSPSNKPEKKISAPWAFLVELCKEEKSQTNRHHAPRDDARKRGSFGTLPKTGMRQPKTTKKSAPRPYMECSYFNPSTLEYIAAQWGGLIIDEKKDGRFINIVYKDGAISRMTTRSGKNSMIAAPSIMAEICKIGKSENFGDAVFFGEILLRGYEREKANGIISALVTAHNNPAKQDAIKDSYGVSYGELLSLVRVSLWDWAPLKEWEREMPFFTPYKERRAMLRQAIAASDTHAVSFVDTWDISGKFSENVNMEKLQNAVNLKFSEIVKNGGEGIVLKNPNMPWGNGTSKNMIKVKPIMEVSLVVSGKSGVNTTLKSSEGAVSVSFKHCEAQIGDIVDVKCNGITGRSLLHPRITGRRDDLLKADSKEKILETWASFAHVINL